MNHFSRTEKNHKQNRKSGSGPDITFQTGHMTRLMMSIGSEFI